MCQEVKAVKCENCGNEFEGKFCPNCGVPAPESLSVCKSCGKEFAGRFCPHCGAPAGPVTCLRCGREFEGRFCPSCGTPAGEAPASAAVPPAQAVPNIIINNDTSSKNINTNANLNQNVSQTGYDAGYRSRKSRVAALILCIIFGVLGIHRFYVGKVGTGILYFFTGGLFGIGWLVDIITIVTGSFRDNLGFPLV